MDFLRPGTWDEALALKAATPEAVPIQGGTDVMVEMNMGGGPFGSARDRARPPALLDLNRVSPLFDWEAVDGRLRIGAGVPYTRVIGELGDRLPGLAQAARTVGSPQIRNRGSIGGNLGAASPAGDSHPPLLASAAEVEVESAARGVRIIPAADFYTGVKRNALEPDELIRAVLMAPADGPQYFSKIGTRNAMVIAVCAFAIALHPSSRTVGTGIGSAGPTPLRATAGEELLASALPWDNPVALPADLLREFGSSVAAAASPIDDVRGSADYRRHALAVMARRTLTWAWTDYRSDYRRGVA